MKIRVQFRRATAAAWSKANVTLAAGEVGFETDTSRLKFGTGIDAWNDLPYANLSSLGSVSSITAGEGLLGGTITSSGTLSIDKNFVATLIDTQVIKNKTFGATLEYLTPLSTSTTESEILIDLNEGPDYYILLNNDSDIKFVNLPDYNIYTYFTIIIRNSGTHTINWPASVRWQDGNTPTLSTNGQEDIFYFSTIDGGATFYATTLGAGYDNPNAPVTQTARFKESNQDFYGRATAISGDGNYAAVSTSNIASGSCNVFIYSLINGLWRQQAVIFGNSIPNSKNFGDSLAFNFYGDTLVIGDSADSTDGLGAGRAWVYNRSSGGAWNQTAALDIADPRAYKNYGYSVTMDTPGNVIAIGAPAIGGINGVGSVYIFSKVANIWTQTAKIVQPGNVTNTAFGFKVVLDASGTYVAIGAPQSNQAHVYNKDGTSWVRQSTLLPSNGPVQNRFGQSLDISGDNNFVVVSDPDGGIGGYAILYGKSGTNWIQVQVINETHANVGNRFGASITLSHEGLRLFITADNEDDKTGKAYTYYRSGLAFAEETVFGPTDAAAGIQFGYSADMSHDGTSFIVSAPAANAAYLFLK